MCPQPGLDENRIRTPGYFSRCRLSACRQPFATHFPYPTRYEAKTTIQRQSYSREDDKCGHLDEAVRGADEGEEANLLL
jgi:hypothetical protein